MICFLPYHWYLAYRERIEERKNYLPVHLLFTVRLCFTRCNLRYCLVYRQANGYRKPGLTYYMLPQLMRPFVTSVETVHTRKIDIMLIDRRFLIKRRSFRNYACHYIRIITVHLHVASYHNSIGTHAPCHFHRHRRADSVFAGLIAAARYHATVRHASYYHRLPHEPAVLKPLHRYKECIHVEVKYRSFYVT